MNLEAQIDHDTFEGTLWMFGKWFDIHGYVEITEHTEVDVLDGKPHRYTMRDAQEVEVYEIVSSESGEKITDKGIIDLVSSKVESQIL